VVPAQRGVGVSCANVGDAASVQQVEQKKMTKLSFGIMARKESTSTEYRLMNTLTGQMKR
jgi:hypothetical protein